MFNSYVNLERLDIYLYDGNSLLTQQKEKENR